MVKVWKDGKCVRTLSGHDGPVLALVVTPDGGEALSGSGDTTIKRWNIQTGACLQTITGHSDTVRWVLLFSFNGRTYEFGPPPSTLWQRFGADIPKLRPQLESVHDWPALGLLLLAECWQNCGPAPSSAVKYS